MATNSIDTKYAVFGLGKTGLSCVRFFARQGTAVTVIDSRDQPPALGPFLESFPATALMLGEPLPQSLGRCKHLILSPGVPRSHPFVAAAIQCGIEVIGDIELFARHAKAPILAVTGSNGKSTVVTMVTEILASAGMNVSSGGNLGTPALDLLGGGEQPDCFVLELSSFQLESTTSLAPSVACVLNVSPDHMDRYLDFSSYVEAKKRIFKLANCVVLNADDPVLRDLNPDCEIRYVALGGHAGYTYYIERSADDTWLVTNGERLMRTRELSLSGEHNYLNALAAAAITDKMQVSRPIQVKVFASFQGLPHRCQSISSHQAVDWIDDSKGTNVGASCAAIAGVFADRQGVLIAGGQAKGADFGALASSIHDRVHSVVLIGEDANQIAAVLTGITNVYFALDMTAAVRLAAKLASPGEAVLLSPSCASFDMFENFEVRGLAFAAAVAELEQT